MSANWLQHWYDAENTPYHFWINMYASKKFQQAMQTEIAWINECLLSIDTSRFEQLAQIFK